MVRPMKDLEQRTKAIRNKAVVITAQTQRFISKFDPVASKVKTLSKTTWKVSVKLHDQASAGINKLSNAARVLSKPLVLGGAAAAAGGAALIGSSLKGAAELEQQQISMQHFFLTT